MAINSTFCDDHNQIQAPYAMSSKDKELVPIPVTAKSLISSGSSSFRRRKSKNRPICLSNNSTRLSPHIEGKTENKVVSSFQLAAKLYKSNSDEFKLTRKTSRKSNKKSVLTLPNQPTALPQSCTVSDMNDSEYFTHIQKPKAQKKKKRQPFQKKNPLPKDYDYEYYDRDADYCSQMNLYLDCSSVDVVKNFKGDCRRKGRDNYDSKTESEKTTPSDVWAVLRNINRFQFYPSPPMSDDSSYEVVSRKKKTAKKKLNRGVYETCRTEQIAYFSNIELNVPRDCSLTDSSQITVIDNQDGLNNICKEVEKLSMESRIPVVNIKNKNLDLPRPAMKKSRESSIKSRIKKSNSSKDTLVNQKLGIPLKSEHAFCGGDGSFDEPPRKSVCVTVEVQTETEPEHKEVEKSGSDSLPLTPTVIYNRADNIGTKTRKISEDKPPRNIPQMMSLRRPIQTRLPWCRTRSQPRPNIAPGSPLTDITSKSVFSSTQGLTFSKLQDSPRTPHQATADLIHPPLTLTAIRRIVAKLKFPLVVLGKDQVSGVFELEEFEYPQFGGLDEHMWPFMVDWMEKPPAIDHKIAKQSKKPTFKDKRTVLTDADFKLNSKKEHMANMNITPGKIEPKQNSVADVKPASRFRDNILKLLYKKTSSHNVGKNILPDRVQRDTTAIPPQIKSIKTGLSKCKSVDVAISSDSITKSPIKTPVVKAIVKPKIATTLPPTSPSQILVPPRKREPQRMWSKAKRASDFIENVINKIKYGMYYTCDLQTKSLSTRPSLQSRTSDTSDLKVLKHESKEVSIQVEVPRISEDFTPKVTIQKKKELNITLPGFEDALPPMEIKSMTRNQIAVKNCIMNVLLQFDVNVPPEGDRSVSFKRSTSCVPLSVTDSKTKVFKCKARILNTVLPAELCSIVPKVMMQILDKDAPLSLSAQGEKRCLGGNASLSTISEYTVADLHEPVLFPLMPQIDMCPELRRLRIGRFSKNPKLWAEKLNSNEKLYIISLREYQYQDIKGLLLPPAPIKTHDKFVIEHPSRVLVLHSEPQLASLELPLENTCCNSAPEPNLCRDLVPYTGNKLQCVGHAIQNATLVALQRFVRYILKANSNSVSAYVPAIQMQTSNNHVYVNFSMTNHQGLGTSLCIDATHFDYESLCHVTSKKSSTSTAIMNYEHPEKRIEYIKHADIKDCIKKDTSKLAPNATITKMKKRGHARYVKLYKKCKSTSHIAAERSNTPLSKVNNLDEFFQALGTAKQLSSIFDGSCGNKIMACISDMKTYITGITPRQAMLVMLLANKKDTTNLTRLRPVILQGIALHRITRVSELDMEVEVIEKERFNKMPEYLDISPVIECPRNNDHLLEELIWIAKTTASDYQRRFDDSSEKLLKSLLEKRKKLNPSYLRVMARYVGLGLLKTPVNHY